MSILIWSFGVLFILAMAVMIHRVDQKTKARIDRRRSDEPDY